jgi:hypothetical protein
LLCIAGSLAFGSPWWVLLGVAIGASGVMELMGRSKLRTDLSSAGRWLAISQLGLLALILLYCLWQLHSFNAKAVAAQVFAALDPRTLEGLDLDEAMLATFLRRIFRIVYLSVIGLSILYQGGMWLYYHLCVRKLQAEVEERTRLAMRVR